MIENKLNFKKILAIGAHPDDLEYGCFGFLSKQKKVAEIHIFVASLGSAGDPSSGLHRKTESLNALEALGCRSVYFREKNGIDFADFGELVSTLTKKIDETDPDLILTMGSHDTHQEHRLLHEITLASARRSRASVLSYNIVSNTLDFCPKIFVDISEFFASKKAAIRCHVSQLAKDYMTGEYLEIFHAHNYAVLHGITKSEAFEVVRLFI
jgi:LmbE family N-acetylglucosaminyl deacetylase